jgi:DNA-binding transcriptional ArsR family regulator
VPRAADTTRLEAGAKEMAQLLKAIAHPNRLLIACQLAGGEKSVGEIEAKAGIPQPHLSRELARLRTAGLVRPRRESKNVYYRIADGRLTALVAALCTAMAASAAKPARKQSKAGTVHAARR